MTAVGNETSHRLMYGSYHWPTSSSYQRMKPHFKVILMHHPKTDLLQFYSPENITMKFKALFKLSTILNCIVSLVRLSL